MAAPAKKRANNLNESSSERDEEDSDSNVEEPMDEDGILRTAEEIQVDFEGRNPIDSDFHGIKQLLGQLFLKAHVNLSELTDVIISQNYVGSVVKQSLDGEGDDDSDDDDDDVNDVFGITSVINLTDKQNLECVQQLRKLLVELCTEHANSETAAFVNNLLADSEKHVGLLINERFVNIPALIVVPLLKSLSSEIKRAKEKKMPFDFNYYILICKFYKLDKAVSKKKSKKNKPKSEEIMWSNPEEEFIDKECDIKFEFSVKNESDTGLTGEWAESDTEMVPHRKVLILSAEKFDSIVNSVEELVKK